MKSETKILSIVLISSVVLLVGSVLLLSSGQKKPNLKTDNPDRIFQFSPLGEKIGTDSAKIKLVEFSDFQCPACKAFEPTLKQVLASYKDNIQFTYKYFPLPSHLNSKPASNFALYAATEGKFWEIHGKLFEKQEEWAFLPNPNDYFLKMGKELGLNENKLKEALDKNTYYPIMNQIIDEGTNAGVDSTPTVFINGKKLNMQSYSDLEATIKQILGK